MPMMRCARLSGGCETIESLDRAPSKWRFTRRALTPSVHGCIVLSGKCGLLHGEPLEDADEFKNNDFMFIVNCQGSEEIGGKPSIVCSAVSRLQPCLWSRCVIFLCTIGKVNQALV